MYYTAIPDLSSTYLASNLYSTFIWEMMLTAAGYKVRPTLNGGDLTFRQQIGKCIGQKLLTTTKELLDCII